MNKKERLLTLLAVALVAAYVIYFTDWFKRRTLMIHYTTRAVGSAMRARRDAPNAVTFGFDGTWRLTEIKVVPVAALQTNDNPLPLWHLVSDSNSIPCKSFRYGAFIRGMRPFVAGDHPKPLETNAAYRIFVTAGKISGQHDFRLDGKPAAAK